jgi:nucleotide-binding universal stress UspA family protein
MYATILVTLDGTPTDRAIIDHVKQLAKLAHSRLVLLHVADGWGRAHLRLRCRQP